MSTLEAPVAAPRPAVQTPPGRRAALDAVVRRTAGALLGAGLLLVCYWWAAGGGVGDLASWADGLTSTGRLAGLVASLLLLVQVLLMARVPLLEKAYGQDRLARVHRLVGFTSFNLLLAHVVLITWGYAAGRSTGTPGTFWDLTTTYPGMLLALAGTVALVLVVATSIKAARKRVRYESWHLLHLYAYVGVGLALPHQLWTGQEFLASPAATVFWWGLWAAAAGSVLVWRVGLPLWRSARLRVRVTAVVPEDHGVVSVYMTGHALHRLSVEAGQFFGWRFLNRAGWSRANPYSLSAAPDGRSLRITVKTLGDGSSTLPELKPGTPVMLEGPYGRLSPRARTQHKVALIGAGVGITPLRALAEGLDYAPGGAVLLYRYGERPLFQAELETLSRERGLELVPLPGKRRSADSWLGTGVGPVDDVTALRSWVPDIAERDVYVCGPGPWAETVRRTAESAGVPAERVHLETFAW